MSTDVGPFQTITEYHASTDNPEDFIHNEDVFYREDCADDTTEWDPGKPVERSPPTGTIATLCVCTDPYWGGGYDCWSLIFRIPVGVGNPWPDCVIGQISGAKINAGWPDKPEGWDVGAPKAFSTPKGFCAIPSWTAGSQQGGDYVIEKGWCDNCAGNIGAPEDCCG